MIIAAIREIKGDAQVMVTGADIDTCTIEWLDGNPTNITKEQIKVKIDELSPLRETIEKRKLEYPEIDDMVVALYDTEDKAAIDAKRAEVKAKYPKP